MEHLNQGLKTKEVVFMHQVIAAALIARVCYNILSVILLKRNVPKYFKDIVVKTLKETCPKHHERS